MNSPLTIKPVATALGAEIEGVDLSRDLDDGTVAAIRQALLDHCVIFFRGQSLDPERHKAFARRFGELFLHPYFAGSRADPAVIDIVREPGDRRVVGEYWHSDTPHVPEPPMGSVLYAVEVPPYGGDTLFSNQYLAYESLSAGFKSMLEGRRALHTDRLVSGPAQQLNAARATKIRIEEKWSETANHHPVVRTHPETGRKALYVNRATTVSFEHMTEEESAPLLKYLFEQGSRPEFSCRFRWTPGAVAFWDNRCTQHLAINDTGSFRRVMRRIQINGDRPF
ncbi:TauD/TfdA family dioxygenase [Pigmentiphaga soli]|uniref:TauD/TfdA family dioxygenase n=1 Tax=Pigmentiphaga soli TaxID=1007095 RepID=A0ABP8GDS2_9BURK